MRRYGEYKKSGIEYIGEIPKSWKVNRVKNIGSVNGRVGWKALKASEYVETGYFFLSTPNIKNIEIDFKNVNFITEERYIESPEIMLQEGDILLVKDGSTLGIVNVIRNLSTKGTVNSSIAVLRIRKLNSIYGYYLLLSNYLQNKISLKKEGMGVPHLFQKDINNFEFLLPPPQEQKAIAQYLDSKTQAIDKKISLLEQKIEYCKELKKSLINEITIQGLNGTKSNKLAKRNWINEIPNNWDTDRLGNIFHERSEKVSDVDYPPLSVTMNGIVPQLSTAAKTKNGDNRKKVLIGDFVINSRSDRKGSSGASNFNGSVSVISIVLKPTNKAFVKFYHYFFKSYSFTEQFYKEGKGIVDDLWSTKYSVMRNIQIPIPPYSKQIQIAKYLDDKTYKIDTIIKNIHQQVDTLKELRKTLINDVVTGKIKVVD